MAIDITMNDVSSGYNISKLQDNFNKIEIAFADALSREGDTPNEMNTDFDLNFYDLLNGGDAHFQQLFIDGENINDLLGAVSGSIQTAIDAAEAAQAAAEAAQVAAESAETGAEAAQAAAEAARDEAVAAASGVEPIVSIDETDIAGAGGGGYILEENKVYIINPHGNDVTIKLPSDAETNHEFTVYLIDTAVAHGTITIEGGGNDIAQDAADFLLDINYTGDRFKLDLPNTNYITTFINILGA